MSKGISDDVAWLKPGNSGTRLSCGLHDCPSKCHQLDDHTRRPCNVIIKTRCTQGHPQNRQCHQKTPASCQKCDHEAKLLREKQAKALDLQRRRDAAQLAHEREMARIEHEYAQEQQKAQDERIRKENLDALEHKKRDLELLRERNQRLAMEASALTPPHSLFASTPTSPAKPPRTGQSNQSPYIPLATIPNSPAQPPRTGQYDQSSPLPKVQTVHLPPRQVKAIVVASPSSPGGGPSPSELDWAHQKRVDGAFNKDIDELMEFTGLEDVKNQVLKIKARIDITKRQGISLKGERFNVVMLGNPGTGSSFLQILHSSSGFLIALASRKDICR